VTGASSRLGQQIAQVVGELNEAKLTFALIGGLALAAHRVVRAEGLIAFKLQALVNDPRRTRDLEDIRELLRANRMTLDMQQIRGYFQLFEREGLLDELLAAS